MPAYQEGPSSVGMPPRSGGPQSPPKAGPPPCPNCRRTMAISQVTPVLFASGLDDVVFRCEKCGGEAKRTVKRV